jgi:hypothetical protein
MRSSHRLPVFTFIGILFAVESIAVASEFEYPPRISVEEVRREIEDARKNHPRLFANEATLSKLRQKANANATSRLLAQHVVKQADLLLNVSPVERTLQGRRLLDKSRRCLKRTLVLSTAYHLTRDKRYAKRCEEEMLAAAGFRDWNPSHFLDVGEMTLALAIGYDWLFSELSDSSRTRIREAIVEKGLILPWETRHKGWVRASNNWGQVCHGGLTAGALAVLEDEPELAAKTVHNALMNVPRSMHAFAPNGSYPEGPGYWAYGTSYNVVLISVIESVLGSDFGLTKAPGFSVTGQYLAIVTGPSGLTFNYADGGSGRSPQSCLFWLADRYDRLDWLLGERERIRRAIDSSSAGGAATSKNRLLPLALLWMPRDSVVAKVDMPLHWSSGGPTPITVHRNSWSDPNTTFFGLKGGSPAAPHGQMDTGSFVLDADGVRWAVDLGAEGYHGIESRGMNLWDRSQSSDRWSIFRLMNHGHNTLVIDDQRQYAARGGEIIQFSADADFPHSIVDLAPVYREQVETAKRGVALIEGRNVLIQDELTGLRPGGVVRWGMVTPGSPGIVGKRSLKLTQGAARMTMSILAPENVTWKIVDIETPRNRWDSPNRGVRMIAFEVTAPVSGEVAIAVVAQPGDAPRKTVAAVNALEKWEHRSD